MTLDEKADLFSRRILAGDCVSEDDLFGVVGVRAIRLGLIPRETVAEWCRHCLAARVALYGEGPAQAWAQDRRERLEKLLAERKNEPTRRHKADEAMAAAAAMVRRMSDPMEAAE